MQNDASHENHQASVLTPLALTGNQRGAMLKEDDQCWQIVRAILMVQ